MTAAARTPTRRWCCTFRRTGRGPRSSRSRATPGSTSPTTARASSTRPTATDTRPARTRAYGELQAESSGIRLLIRTISRLTGLHIDHYMQVDLLGFYRISNVIGGVLGLPAARRERPDRFRRLRLGLFRHQPAGRLVDDQGHAGPGVRPATARPAQRRSRPDPAPAVLPVGRVQEDQLVRAAAQPVRAALVAHRGQLIAADRSWPEPGVSSPASSSTCPPATSPTRRIPNVGPQTIYPDGVETSIVGVDTAALPGFIATVIGKPADPGLAKATAASRRPSRWTCSTAPIPPGSPAATRPRCGRPASTSTPSTAPPPRPPDADPVPGRDAGAGQGGRRGRPQAKLTLTSSVARVTLDPRRPTGSRPRGPP